MPRHVTPPRFQPSAPAQPYPGQQLAENPEWSKHHQQGPVKVDWQDYAGLQEQLKEQEKFEELQGNIEQAINKRTNYRRNEV